ncbi:MAG: DUF3052 domain-containing protein [Cellulomonadaceae bacterium]|nr:DUF3052 domain-containing protein [Cellulomonadaceae bacterium]
MVEQNDRLNESAADRLGFTSGQVVQEFGWDDDVDDDLRADIEDIIDGELADEDYDDVTDAVIVWWRSDDGELADMLLDALTVLDDGAPVWLFTVKAGRDGHVGLAEIQEASTTAGLHAMNTFSIAPQWSATRLDNKGRSR